MRHFFVQLNFLTSVRLPLIHRESLTDLQIRESHGESVRLGIYAIFILVSCKVFVEIISCHFIWNYLQAIFVTLLFYKGCWHPSTLSMTIVYLNHNILCIFFYLLHTYVWHDTFHLDTFHMIPFSNINNISTFVSISSSTVVSFRQGCHAYLGNRK